METADVETFLLIVKYHNISRAAEAAFMTQSAASKRLTALEREIGIPLVVRNKGKKNIELTTYGEEFVTIAQQWLRLKESIAALPTSSSRVRIAIGGVHSVNYYLFPPLYRKLIEHEPPVELALSTHHTWEIYDRLEARELDAGFVNYPAHYSQIDVRPVHREPFVVLQLKTGRSLDKPIHPDELASEKEIFHTWYPEYQQWHDYWWKPNKARVAEFNSPFLLEVFLNREGYWAVVPKSIADALTKRYPFQARTLLHPPPERVCYLAIPKVPRAPYARGLQIFKTLLADFLRGNKAKEGAKDTGPNDLRRH